jgi:hypothetical protein
MKIKAFFLVLFLAGLVNTFAQSRTIVNLTEGNTSVATYSDKEINLSGKANLHLTHQTLPLLNSVINLNTEDAWLYFDNIRPQPVIDTLLKYVYVKGIKAVQNTNVRVIIYKHGTAIVAHTPALKPLKVFTGANFTGDSASYSLFSLYSALGSMDNKIRSFKLKKGYMATMAITSDGTGYSRVFIADDKDLEVTVLPALLDQKISFIRVMTWEYVSKKGWGGYNPTEYALAKATWRYDWNSGGETSPLVEYVPIRQKLNWPAWSSFTSKNYISHMLGLNEPDHPEQHKDDNGEKAITISQALAQWPDHLKTGLRVGSPACTDPNWLYQFIDSCNARNYRVDFVAWHAYWGGKSPQNWYNDLKAIYQRTGRPIWITEWNNGANWTTETWPTADRSLSAANAAKQLADMKAILNVLDTASFIERYAIYNWVQDCRAMVLADTLTPAGKYYAATTPPLAFNRKYEVIPTFSFANPTMSILPSGKTVTLTINDPNLDYYGGYILEKKTDNGNYVQIADTNSNTLKTFVDSIDFTKAKSVRYRAKSKLPNGTYSAYSNVAGWDATEGSDTIQCGVLSLSNGNWSPVMFKKPYSANPVIVTGSPSINNSTILMTPRVKLVSNTSHFNIQLAPWQYQTVKTFTRDETVPYAVFESGKNFNFGGLKAQTGRVSVYSAWTTINFATPFETIPVVFANQASSSTTFPTNVRVRNVTKTGFDAKIMKERAVTSPAPGETMSYLAITPGAGSFNNKKVIVGSTADKAVGTNYAMINFNDSVANPIFISQMQTCNDDSTAALRVVILSAKSAYVTKQKEKSTSALTTTNYNEKAGWMVIGVDNIVSGIQQPTLNQLQFYPNPVKDEIYFTSGDADNQLIDIYSLSGILIKSQKPNNNRLNVSDLQKGLYFIRTKQGDALKFMKE